MNICGEYAIAKILDTLNSILSTIQMIGPILAIVSFIYLFIKLINNPDEDKVKKGYKIV